jgi:hypothetical protein
LPRNFAIARFNAADLREQGPDVSKPYDHQLVQELIKRLLGARQRSR